MMKLSIKKGQGALEYMQTYGWAILVVLVIGITMWQLGVFGGKSGINRATGFAKLKVLDPSIKYTTDDNIDDDDNLTFEIMNTEQAHIRILSNATGGDCLFLEVESTGLDAGETTTATATNCTDLDPGEPFGVNVTIVYRYKLGAERINRTNRGVIQGTAE